jgi:hypothetical protein
VTNYAGFAAEHKKSLQEHQSGNEK